jgi:predicted hotdog family 3-hydroxylacyl-ACP dehydratase
MLNGGTRLDHAAIAARVPHQGRMCLLDRVLGWDDAHIVCEATGHTDPAHPLRDDGRLGAAIGVEYAAQAMAVHGALMAGPHGAPTPGYLASVRALQLHADRLDLQPAPLRVTATRLSGDGRAHV